MLYEVITSLRRAEQRVSPDLLLQLMPGYGHTLEAAKVILELLAEAKELPLYRAVENLLKAISPE